MKTFGLLKEDDTLYRVIFNCETYKCILEEVKIRKIWLLTKEQRSYDRYSTDEYTVDVMVSHFTLSDDTRLSLDVDPNHIYSAYNKESLEPGQGVGHFYSTSLEKTKEYINKRYNHLLIYHTTERDKHNDIINILTEEQKKWQ